MIERYEKLFQSGDSGEKELLISPNVSMIKVEIKGSGSLDCKAMLDRNSDKQVIGAIKASDFSKVSTMSGGAIYTLEVSGYYKVFFTLSGSADVYIKTIC